MNNPLPALKVKSGAAWKEYDTARLQISVGQSYHEGTLLETTLEWTAKNFKKTIINVNDTLQRHNLEFAGLTKKEACLQSEAQGREWIERNYKFLSPQKNVEIIRWDQWLNHPLFKEKKRIVDTLYAHRVTYRKILNEEVNNFWNRKKNKAYVHEAQYDRFKLHATRYLNEECAAFLLMFEKEKAADIYPGSTLLPCAVFRGEDGFGKRGYTRIDFRQTEN